MSELQQLLTSAIRQSGAVAGHSHYYDPIEGCDLRACGRSRDWGDASEAVQRASIEELRSAAQRASFSLREQAFVLAVARVESGFNPDAAARSSSATGLGQFIDATGAAYGLDDSNRFDSGANAQALVAHLKFALSWTRARHVTAHDDRDLALAYAYHHDGPKLDSYGEEIAKNAVLPASRQFFSWLRRN